jgi:hypothetical protein
MAAAGMSQRAIANELNKAGVPAVGGSWHRGTGIRVLRQAAAWKARSPPPRPDVSVRVRLEQDPRRDSWWAAVLHELKRLVEVNVGVGCELGRVVGVIACPYELGNTPAENASNHVAAGIQRVRSRFHTPRIGVPRDARVGAKPDPGGASPGGRVACRGSAWLADPRTAATAQRRERYSEGLAVRLAKR